MQLDLSRWAVVAHKDDSGFGRQATDIRRVLGLGYHLVIPSERLWDKPISGTDEILLSPDDPAEKVESLLNNVQGVIFFERHSWHPQLLPAAKRLGVRTVCIPNWEWFQGDDPAWNLCDLFIPSSQFSLSIVRKFGRTNSIHLPLAIDMDHFPERKITGPARLFIHNAGIVDPDDRKGTRDTIEAFKRVKNDDLRLLVRMQKEAELPELDDRISVETGNLDNPAKLYASGSLAIQPSKMEGNGFLVVEPVISGLPVITLDYPPMNEFVRQKDLLVRKRWLKRRAFPSQWVKHAHLRLPDIMDLARKIAWAAENDLDSISSSNRNWAESTFTRSLLKAKYESVLNALLNKNLESYLAEHSIAGSKQN